MGAACMSEQTLTAATVYKPDALKIKQASEKVKENYISTNNSTAQTYSSNHPGNAPDP